MLRALLGLSVSGLYLLVSVEQHVPLQDLLLQFSAVAEAIKLGTMLLKLHFRVRSLLGRKGTGLIVRRLSRPAHMSVLRTGCG